MEIRAQEGAFNPVSHLVGWLTAEEQQQREFGIVRKLNLCIFDDTPTRNIINMLRRVDYVKHVERVEDGAPQKSRPSV